MPGCYSCVRSPSKLYLMVYFRSRRFYTGLVIGLIPFLFLAGRAAGLFGSGPVDDGDRIVVRNYSGACDDPDAVRSPL